MVREVRMGDVALAQYATALWRTRYTVSPISPALARPLIERYHWGRRRW
jgi:hypothetical protein